MPVTALRPAWACLRASPSLRSAVRRLAFPALRDWLPPSKALLFLAVRPYTMLSRARLHALYTLAGVCNREKIPGAFVECGVWKGGSAAVLAARRGGRNLHLFDSFAGCPAPSPLDVNHVGRQGEAGEAAASVRDVLGLLQALGLSSDQDQTTIYPGWFDETVPKASREIGRIALLHIDADWFASTWMCLSRFYPLVAPGGYVVIDDYGHWAGARKAVDEYREQEGIAELIRWSDGTGVWWRKT